MADQDQLVAFRYHWKAAGLSSTTAHYLSWLARLDVDDDTTDLELAAALADMTPSQRHHALRAARAWGRWRGTGWVARLRPPRCRSIRSRRLPRTDRQGPGRTTGRAWGRAGRSGPGGAVGDGHARRRAGSAALVGPGSRERVGEGHVLESLSAFEREDRPWQVMIYETGRICWRSRCRPRARAWTNRTLWTPERRHGARVVAHAAR